MKIYKEWLLYLLFGSLVSAQRSPRFDMAGFKNGIVDRHNEFRRIQRASDMKELAWSNELERDAMNWARRCQFKHSHGRHGENMYYMEAPHITERQFLEQALDSWFTEGLFWRSSANCGNACAFTQMVWSLTSRIGCAVQKCRVLTVNPPEDGIKGAWFLVCHYNPKGNNYLDLPYESGTPCSKCDPWEFCRNKLCAEERLPTPTPRSSDFFAQTTEKPQKNPQSKTSPADLQNAFMNVFNEFVSFAANKNQQQENTFSARESSFRDQSSRSERMRNTERRNRMEISERRNTMENTRNSQRQNGMELNRNSERRNGMEFNRNSERRNGMEFNRNSERRNGMEVIRNSERKEASSRRGSERNARTESPIDTAKIESPWQRNKGKTFTFGSGPVKTKFKFRIFEPIKPTTPKPRTTTIRYFNAEGEPIEGVTTPSTTTSSTTTSTTALPSTTQIVTTMAPPGPPQVPNSCVDTDVNCIHWKIYCEDNIYVFENCRRTCNSCYVPPPPPVPPSRQPSSIRQSTVTEIVPLPQHLQHDHNNPLHHQNNLAFQSVTVPNKPQKVTPNTTANPGLKNIAAFHSVPDQRQAIPTANPNPMPMRRNNFGPSQRRPNKIERPTKIKRPRAFSPSRPMPKSIARIITRSWRASQVTVTPKTTNILLDIATQSNQPLYTMNPSAFPGPTTTSAPGIWKILDSSSMHVDKSRLVRNKQPGSQIDQRASQHIQPNHQTAQASSQAFERAQPNSRTFQNAQPSSQTFQNAQQNSQTFQNAHPNSQTFHNAQQNSQTVQHLHVDTSRHTTHDRQNTQQFTRPWNQNDTFVSRKSQSPGNQMYVTTTTDPYFIGTTAFSSPCEDVDSRCSQWARLCSADWSVKTVCPLSCGICQPSVG